MVQIDQPKLMDYKTMTERFGGRICFWNCADIQWGTQESTRDEEIIADIEEMVNQYNRFNGGLMARHYPQPWDINLSPERQTLICKSGFCGLWVPRLFKTEVSKKDLVYSEFHENV